MWNATSEKAQFTELSIRVRAGVKSPLLTESILCPSLCSAVMDSGHLDRVSIVIKPLNDFANNVKWHL